MEYQAMPPLEVQDSEGQDIQDTDVQPSSSMQQGGESLNKAYYD